MNTCYGADKKCLASPMNTLCTPSAAVVPSVHQSDTISTLLAQADNSQTQCSLASCCAMGLHIDSGTSFDHVKQGHHPSKHTQQ